MLARRLEIVYRKTADLVPYARNAKLHPDEQVSQIMGSIVEFGFNNPIALDENLVLFAGHGRLLAAHRLKMDEVPTIQVLGLSEAQKRAYRIADNRIGANSGYDPELLALEMQELAQADFDVPITGFGEAEIAAILKQASFAPGSEDEQGKLDELKPKMITCPECGHEWDTRAPAEPAPEPEEEQ